MIEWLQRVLVWSLYQTNVWGGLLAIRLVYWTGKSRHPVHPKHFLDKDWRSWYLPYMQAGDVALDAGCNNGMHTMAAAAVVRTIYGFDYSSKHLATAQALVAQAGFENVRLSSGSAIEYWHYANSSFDVVLFQDVLEHIVERDFALGEVHRVLKPEGRLLLAVPKRDTSWKALRARFGVFAYSDPDHKTEYTEAELRDELGRSGFVIEVFEPVVYDTPWTGFIDVVGGFSLPLYRRLAQWKRDAALRHPAESSGFRVVARRGRELEMASA